MWFWSRSRDFRGQPEQAYVVTVTADQIEVRVRSGEAASLPLSEIERILVETNDSGPWGMDVWWVLEGGGTTIRFPQGAQGEAAFLEFAETLSGFEVRGMNSTDNAVFECWPNPLPLPSTAKSRA